MLTDFGIPTYMYVYADQLIPTSSHTSNGGLRIQQNSPQKLNIHENSIIKTSTRSGNLISQFKSILIN